VQAVAAVDHVEITIEQVWLASSGRREQFQKLLSAQHEKAAVVTLACRALDAVFGGEVPVGMRLLERAIRQATPTEEAYLLDLLVPLVTSRGDFAASRDYIDRFDGQVECLVPAFISSRAVMAAAGGDLNESRQCSADSTRMLGSIEEPNLRARILSRLALAAYYRGEFDTARDLALETVQWADRAKCGRLAATAFSLLSIIAYCVSQDGALAVHYASELHRCAILVGDLSMKNRAVITELAFAAELGDVGRVDALSALQSGAPLPQQFAVENFNLAIVATLRAGWAGRFDVALAALESIRKTALSLAQKSTCDVLEAVVCLASWDIKKTRRLVRLVISQTAAPRKSDHLHDVWRRQTARTLAALLCLAIGDHVRGRRVLRARTGLVCLTDTDVLIESVRIREEAAPAVLRGYVRFLNRAIQASIAYRPQANLSAAEIDVLHALNEGTTLAQIAIELGKSPKTVRCQVASIYAKLDVSNRTQALRRAAELGLAPVTSSAGVAVAS
jgi:DNA-binding CsgD family transcriptional regulator